LEDDSPSQRGSEGLTQGPEPPSLGEESAIRKIEHDEILALRAAVLSHRRTEADLKVRLDEAKERIAFLEDEPALPQGVPHAPMWVQGRLRRVVERVRLVFHRLASLDEAIERYQNALMFAQRTIDDLTVMSETRAPAVSPLEMLGATEETLRELVDASVEIESLREFAEAMFEAEEEMRLALQQSEVSPLKLGATRRAIRV